MTDLIPSEHQECAVFKEWLDLKGLLYTKTAQETYTKSFKQKLKNMKEGVRPGLPDYIVITKEGLIFVEMKRLKGGVVSEYQKEWITALNECNGVEARVCRGAGEAIAFVEEFIA